MRYYSILRPIGIGTLPKTAEACMEGFINFEEKTFIPAIGRTAWGYVDVTEPIKEAEAWDLVPETAMKMKEAYAKIYAAELVAYGWEPEKALSEANALSMDELQTFIEL